MARVSRHSIEVNGKHLPIELHLERRNGVRASLGKHTIIMRIPQHDKGNVQLHIDRIVDWLTQLDAKKPGVFDKYTLEPLKNKTLTVLGRDRYSVQYEEVQTELVSGQIIGDEIRLQMPSSIHDFDKRKHGRKLLSKLIAKKYRNELEAKVDRWNDEHFQKDIVGISLKYNSTNWGSCSTGKRINISTRSLLLPEATLDYIIVHELSHLIEMNHSARFWRVVSSVMPEYKVHEAYIKKHGSTIDF